MATVLDKELKRQVTVNGVDYTVVVDPEGIRLTGKGKRRPEVELRWRDLLSGEAAMAVTVWAAWLVGSQSKTRRECGFWVFLTSNVLWIAWSWHVHAWALLVLQVCLGAMNIRGVSKNET